MRGGVTILFIAGIASFVIASIIYGIWRERKRRQQLRQVADDLGLEYVAKGEHPLYSVVHDFRLFSHGRSRKRSKLIAGETDDLTIGVFDYAYTTSSGENSTTHRQSVVALHSDAIVIPCFNLRPQNMLDRLGAAMGLQDIDFENHPNFSQMFVLQGEDEAAIRTFFDGDWLDFLENYRGFSIEGRNGSLIFYKARYRIRPNEIKNYLGKAYEIYGHIIERSAG